LLQPKPSSQYQTFVEFDLTARKYNLRDNEREAEGSGNVVFEKDAENFVDGEKE